MTSKAKIYGEALIQKLNGNYYVVYFILFLSLCYIGYLSFSIHEGIFYAGDQALKSLQVKQIAAGYGFKYLHLPQPDWVKDVWNAGYFPLKPPFFYPSPKGYLIVYPPLFQIINAPLYSMFGIAGLYILPLLCTFVLLGWTIFLLKRCGITPINIALALFILVFCSPLILYGVMFWEHLPAVLLLFAGLSFIAATPSRIGVAVALGLVGGLSIWLRPEALMMIFLYGLAAAVLYLRERKRVYIAFVAALAFSLVPWFIFNKIEYGSIFGIHGMQVLADNDPETRMGLKNGWRNLVAINYISFRHFLFLLLLFPILYGLNRSRDKTDLRLILLAAIVILFSILTPFILPNDGVVQWGPRYFLAIIPITLVALFLAEKKWSIITRWNIPLWLTLSIIAISAYSFYHNTHGGGYRELRWRYTKRIGPIYDLLNKKPGNVVIVSHQSMSYDFGYLFDKNYFFSESGDDSLRRLLPLLKSNGVHEFIYIFDPRIPTLPKMLEDSSTRHYWDEAAAAAARHKWMKDDYDFKIFTIQ
ncbi:MAG TPA: hypothetical protein VG052_00590 [Puia sp.]|jgi:hypothetical protein|nr:hypothetical protein [Puia sp.]